MCQHRFYRCTACLNECLHDRTPRLPPRPTAPPASLATTPCPARFRLRCMWSQDRFPLSPVSLQNPTCLTAWVVPRTPPCLGPPSTACPVCTAALARFAGCTPVLPDSHPRALPHLCCLACNLLRRSAFTCALALHASHPCRRPTQPHLSPRTPPEHAPECQSATAGWPRQRKGTLS